MGSPSLAQPPVLGHPFLSGPIPLRLPVARTRRTAGLWETRASTRGPVCLSRVAAPVPGCWSPLLQAREGQMHLWRASAPEGDRCQPAPEEQEAQPPQPRLRQRFVCMPSRVQSSGLSILTGPAPGAHHVLVSHRKTLIRHSTHGRGSSLGLNVLARHVTPRGGEGDAGPPCQADGDQLPCRTRGGWEPPVCIVNSREAPGTEGLVTLSHLSSGVRWEVSRPHRPKVLCASPDPLGFLFPALVLGLRGRRACQQRTP